MRESEVEAYLVRRGKALGEEQCPVCGYYCLGKGGHGCIDKPALKEKAMNHEFGNGCDRVVEPTLWEPAAEKHGCHGGEVSTLPVGGREPRLETDLISSLRDQITALHDASVKDADLILRQADEISRLREEITEDFNVYAKVKP